MIIITRVISYSIACETLNIVLTAAPDAELKVYTEKITRERIDTDLQDEKYTTKLKMQMAEPVQKPQNPLNPQSPQDPPKQPAKPAKRSKKAIG